jgi:hypothetical protein
MGKVEWGKPGKYTYWEFMAPIRSATNHIHLLTIYTLPLTRLGLTLSQINLNCKAYIFDASKTIPNSHHVMAMIAIEKRGGSKEKLPPKLRNQ